MYLESKYCAVPAAHGVKHFLSCTTLPPQALRERVHSTYAAMGGGGVWPLRTSLYKGGGGGAQALRMY